MHVVSLLGLAEESLTTARAASSSRSAHTIHGGHDHALRQTMIALVAGHGLGEHESPGEATLQVLSGRVRLTAGAETGEAAAGDFIVIPPARHSLDALEDSVVVLSVVTR